MKKFLFPIMLVFLLFVAGCASTATQETNTSADRVLNIEDFEGDIVYIGERFFATQITDIMLNSTEQYLGRAIRYEGIFWISYWPPSGRDHYYVIRFTDGCCGSHHGSVGFELYLNGIAPVPDGAWVEVTGVLERSQGDSIQHVHLRAISIVELEERGTDFVSN